MRRLGISMVAVIATAGCGGTRVADEPKASDEPGVVGTWEPDEARSRSSMVGRRLDVYLKEGDSVERVREYWVALQGNPLGVPRFTLVLRDTGRFTLDTDILSPGSTRRLAGDYELRAGELRAFARLDSGTGSTAVIHGFLIGRFIVVSAVLAPPDAGEDRQSGVSLLPIFLMRR